MIYNKKAIIFDLDGTALQNTSKLPSKTVLDAVHKAQQEVSTILSTSRNWKSSRDIAKALNITDPIVTLGGSQVVDPKSGKVIWEQDLDPGVAKKVVELATLCKTSTIFNFHTNKMVKPKSYKAQIVEPILYINIADKELPVLIKSLKKIPMILIEQNPTTKKGVSEVIVKHVHATKFMALQTIAKKIGLDPKSCIGVGDSGADITLLNFCGVKVAMGNAVTRLKELAQHVAPDVKQDGLAWVIDKFLFTPVGSQPQPKKN